VNRGDYKRIAELRVADAAYLLRGNRYAAAYYLAGYAIECALKACIARQFRGSNIPDKGTVDSFMYMISGCWHGSRTSRAQSERRPGATRNSALIGSPCRTGVRRVVISSDVTLSRHRPCSTVWPIRNTEYSDG